MFQSLLAYRRVNRQDIETCLLWENTMIRFSGRRMIDPMVACFTRARLG